MPDISIFSPRGFDILRVAKRCACSDGAQEISPIHLLQACVSSHPDLVRATLKDVSIGESQVQAFFSRAGLCQGPLQEPTAKKRLSASAAALAERAEGLAREHPSDKQALLEPVHLWASACNTGEIKLWLKRECGWNEADIRDLSSAAMKNLPLAQPVARSRLTDSELEVLNRFCHRNLTALAAAGRLSPAYGMDTAREQAARCLLKRDKRSLVATGPAGVGKTKLVEDLAIHIVRGEIPELSGCQVFELDLPQFTRGTHLVGSRAERWAQLTQVLRDHPDEIILFIDELHTIVGLAIEGQAMDLANVLKPLMVDDKVRIIGATTSEEYRRHIDGDPALARRFTEIKVPEPDRDTMLRLLAEIAPQYEAHHGVRYSPEALAAIYDLAFTYFPNQAFPAKGVDLLDEVGVHVRIGHRQTDSNTPKEVIVQDVSTTLQRVWGVEPAAVEVDIAALLKERVIGQDHAADRLADAVITSAMRFRNQRAAGPRAKILFLGPPGVGKSYMAEVLADILFPGRRNFLVMDMTEFSGQHAGEHARWRLLGPPPPYVGWENGGLLTCHALQNPVSVVLVDEFEKADPEARNILLRVFNDGWVQDGRGRIVSFKGIYFVITANAGRSLWDKVQKHIGFVYDESSIRSGAEYSDAEIRTTLADEGFSPELLSRLSDIVAFNSLRPDDLARVASLKLAELRDNALVEDLTLLEYPEETLSQWLVQHARPAGDVRGLRAAFERYIETPVARWRWHNGPHDQAVALKLEPHDQQVRLIVETKTTAGDRIDQLLFGRIASVFAGQADRARRMRTAGARLGS